MTDRTRTAAFNAERRARLRAGLRIRRDTWAEIRRLLGEAEQQVRTALAGTPTDFQAYYLPQLQAQIRQAMSRAAEASAVSLDAGAVASWQAGIDLVDAPLAAGGIRISGIIPIVNTDQLGAMRSFMTDRIRDVSLQAANRIASELGLTAIGSQSVGDAVRNIENLFDKQARSRALTITRTELGRAYGVATQARQEQAAAILKDADGNRLLKKQWRRSGKTHSRLHHDSIDGQIREVDESFTLGNGVELMHPRDPKGKPGETINCGCESLPWMEKWDVATPGRREYTAEEIARDPRKAELANSIPLSAAGL